MVVEQTRSVVESKYESDCRETSPCTAQVSSFYLCICKQTSSDFSCAEFGGRHWHQHQRLFQSVPGAEFSVQLHHLHQPRPRQDRRPVSGNRPTGLLQVHYLTEFRFKKQTKKHILLFHFLIYLFIYLSSWV